MRRDALKSLNQSIEQGEVRNRGGDVLSSALEEALVTDDGKLGYPVSDGIPVLLESEAIQLEPPG